MSLNKFLDDDFGDKLESENNKEELHIPNSNYKNRVNSAIESSFGSHGFNLMDIEAVETVKKKIPMSLYFDEDDLLLLKAIAHKKNTTVNKIVMNIIEDPLKTTRNNLSSNFNIKKLAHEYDKKCRKRK